MYFFHLPITSYFLGSCIPLSHWSSHVINLHSYILLRTMRHQVSQLYFIKQQLLKITYHGYLYGRICLVLELGMIYAVSAKYDCSANKVMDYKLDSPCSMPAGDKLSLFSSLWVPSNFLLSGYCGLEWRCILPKLKMRGGLTQRRHCDKQDEKNFPFSICTYFSTYIFKKQEDSWNAQHVFQTGDAGPVLVPYPSITRFITQQYTLLSRPYLKTPHARINGFYLGSYFIYFVAIFLTDSWYNESCQKACQNGYQGALSLSPYFYFLSAFGWFLLYEGGGWTGDVPRVVCYPIV